MKRFVMGLLFVLGSVRGLSAQEDTMADAVKTYATIVYANYEDSYQTAVSLQQSIDVFIAEPSEETLQQAKDAWLAAREVYGQTEGFRFYGGPIDDEDGPEGFLNAWPLDEAYIDYVDGDETAGIINNTADYPEITTELLQSLNEKGAEENIATGYHAIEFLLWGQDFYDDSAGKRPFTDYTTAENADRRAQYLKIVTDLLVEQLASLVAEWNPASTTNYQATFLALPPQDALTLIVTGVGSLANSELPGERIYTAYDNQDQEDEHSCFSDNTHRDIYNNFISIKNIYLGEYTRLDGSIISGTGLDAVLADVNPELNQSILDLLVEIETAINELHTPFDQAIISEDYRPQVLATADLIFDLGDLFAEVAIALDLQI